MKTATPPDGNRKLMRAVCFHVMLFSTWLFAVASPGQLFRIDINGTVRGDVTAPGFTPWYVAPDITGGTTATRSFTNFTYTLDPDTGQPIATNVSAMITCTVKMTVPATADSTHYLNANYANKNGNSTSPDPDAGWRLSEDGCWSHWKDDSLSVDQPNTNGGAISLTIAGLSAGVHSITTYHNDPWGPAGASWHRGVTNISRCIVSANGAPMFTNTPTVVATNDGKCGFAFFYVTNSYDGEPVALNFDPDHGSPLDFTILNGFEIDRPFAPGMTATALVPTPGYEHAFAHNDDPLPGAAKAGYLTLQWQPASFAISNYLYFGTNARSVLNATTVSPEYQGASAAIAGTTNSYDVTNLNSLLTYYWRVDQLDIANGATNLVKGYVWEFRTRRLAFPSAEGYGRWARGGRGGRVIEVTNLNDSGPGSYRAAIEASGPRTIVFRVSGVIWLNSPCVINNGYVTIAGQTAPGGGICIANWRAGMSSPNDVIMRFMRFRVGDHAKQSMDAMSTSSARWAIVDHVTSSWWTDVGENSLQTGKVGSENSMVSYQHNILSEGLSHSYHYNDALRAQTGCTNCYGEHSLSASIGGEIASYHHNLVADTRGRNWDLAGSLDQSSHYAGSVDLRNNVVYNWDNRTTDGGCARLQYVNNYYESYSPNPSAKHLWKPDTINTNWGIQYAYVVGNVMVGVPDSSPCFPSRYFTNNWANGAYNGDTATMALSRANSPMFPSYVDTQSASNAYKVVLSDVGCNEPEQDLIDRRVVSEALNRTVHYEGTNGNPYVIDGVVQGYDKNRPGIIDSQTDVHDYQNTNSSLPDYSPNAPWPAFNTPRNPADFLDTDHDGLPDWWERIKGLNTNSPPGDFSDANVDRVGDGYTELERYLNWLAQPHYDCATGTVLNVDLTQYTRGFTNASLGAVYGVFGVVNGTVGLTGRTARFTPTIGTNGLGSFEFKVTDNTDFSYTNTVNVHIVAAPVNHAPVLAAISNRAIDVGYNLVITNVATDSDTPAQTLTYSLMTALTNANINANSGVFNWRPLVAQAGSTNPFSVVVTDNGTPSLGATQSFSVVVNPLTLPSILSPQVADGQLEFSVTGQAGPDYAVQSSSNLIDWNTLFVTNPPAMPFRWSTNTGALPSQFYRVKVGPPLP